MRQLWLLISHSKSQVLSYYWLLTPRMNTWFVLFFWLKYFENTCLNFFYMLHVFFTKNGVFLEIFSYLHMLTPNTCFNFRLFHAWLTTPKTSLITNKNLLACSEFLWEKPFRWLLITVMILLWVCVEPTRKIVYFLCYRSCFSFANNNNQNNNI